MKIQPSNFQKSSGLTLIEVLIAMIIVTIGAVSFLLFQKTSWLQAAKTNRYLLAGQVIQKQIEKKRMWIASNPDSNYASFISPGACKQVTEIDSSTTPQISITYNICDTLHAPDNSTMHACQVDVTASWGTSDNLKVTTCFARNF